MNVEKQTASSTREGVSLVLADAFECEDNTLNVVHTIAISEPGSEDADDPNSDNRVELRENSDDNTIIASSRKQGVDQGLNLSVCGMTLASGTTGIFENNECSPAANRSVVGSEDLSKSSSRESLARIGNDSSIKAHTQDEKSDKYQDIPESFEQASNVEEAWVARGAHSMFVDDLFGMDSNGSAQVSQWGHHEDNLSHHSGRFSELSIAEALEMGDGKMKAVAVSGNSDAEKEEAYECEMSPEAENFLSGSNKPCAEMDSEATYSAEQSGGQEERRVYIQEALDISRFTEDQNADGLDGTKIEGSATRDCTFDQTETITMATVANQEELNARNCTNFADQVFFKENSGVKRSIENEFEYSTYQGIFTAQQSSVSLDTGAFRDTGTAMHDESIGSGSKFSTSHGINNREVT
ncbi:uncharacterized protein A4U43_C09F1870 [Asparagus officinalis]|uniref:Uncharacterized protein n=1 Tax=Asparagus officinalis TaxID=4686 RepID=A0A5P1E4J1_ASPOF|nr:uncharacterized protein A4U43_C09F1870 [Asparagus officinalis]